VTASGLPSQRTLAVVRHWANPERDRHLAEARLVHLPGNIPPWTDTGIRVRRGEWITLLASGRLILSHDLDLWYGPRLALWGRVGERGTIFNGTRDTHSFAAEADGPLFLSLYNGEWATPQGDLATPVEAYATTGGALEVLVLRWKGTARDGLAALARTVPDDPLVAGELERLRSPIVPPEGWRHLWFLGTTEIFRDAHVQGRRAIHVDTRSDVGILQTRVDLPLAEDTTIEWRWRMDELPATGAEDSPVTHDYVSLAVEFDNGKDLTWYWSAGLPAGRHYACPLPLWTARETHWVVRSGSEGLGEWFDESRPITADYRAAVGEPPARIVGVWLIAVTLFRRGRAQATFADIRLRDGARLIQVL
jgi:hypothetical protein